MSTENSDDEELEELEERAREVPDERDSLGRGPEVLRDRLREASEQKEQLTIRLDADIVAQFKELAGPDGSYQTLVNRALREWLETGGLRGLLREEIEAIRDDIVRELEDAS